MTALYVLTAAAEADLRSVVRYTRQQWGEAQVRLYMGKLERGIEQLAAGKAACGGSPQKLCRAIQGQR